MNRIGTLAALGLIVMVVGCGPKRPTATVNFSYNTEPQTPLDEDYMHIAVRNANVSGSTAEFDEKKWSSMTADLIQYHLEQAKEQHGIPLKLVDREHLKMALEEKDLAAAGMTDAGDDVADSQLAGAKAIITSKVTIKIDKQKGKSRTIDGIGAIAGRWGGGGSVSTKETEKESRNITVTCQFQLKDAGSNDIIVSFNGKPTQHFTKAKGGSPFFGSGKTEADMTPRDKIIGKIVETQAQKFLAKFVPTETEYSVAVKPSKHESSINGVRAMVVDDWSGALAQFQMAIAEDRDDHASHFGAGVCCEKMKNFKDAKKHYKLAASLKSKEAKYKAAVQRVSDTM